MYYLKDSLGNTVRAVLWEADCLIIIKRHDTGRIETCHDLQTYDEQNIAYTVLEKFDQRMFEKGSSFAVSNLPGHLTLVKESTAILKNISLQEDDSKEFKKLMQKTWLCGALLAGLAFVSTFFLIPKSEKKIENEIEIVQVMDRSMVERIILEPASNKKVKTFQVKPFTQKVKPSARSNKTLQTSIGALSALGSLKKSQQMGGVKLHQAEASPGLGLGGRRGSGGIQSSVYSKGLFSTSLGQGHQAQGAGGYGTKGKGGGQAGYGKIQLVGSGGQSYFQPIESEAFVGGGLDRNEIAAVIQRHLSEVRSCYEQGLQNKPNLSGRIAIKFLIGPQGFVTLAQVDHSSLGHGLVETCIRDRLKTWNFPHPEGGVTVKVTYPFILRRVSDS